MERETNLNEIVGIVEMLNFFYIKKFLGISMGFEQPSKENERNFFLKINLTHIF